MDAIACAMETSTTSHRAEPRFSASVAAACAVSLAKISSASTSRAAGLRSADNICCRTLPMLVSFRAMEKAASISSEQSSVRSQLFKAQRA